MCQKYKFQISVVSIDVSLAVICEILSLPRSE
jgi:hypothetical protein